MKNRKMMISIICIIIIMIMIVTIYYYSENNRTYELKVPTIDVLQNITLEIENEKAVDEEKKMKEVLNILNNKRKSKQESIQDFPINVNELVRINFNFKGSGTSTIFMYKKKDKYYVEQPYNGIYEISKSEYDDICKLIK